MPEKTLILIVGCHRSGTSAVAGCLSAMGVEFGENLLGPAFDNPKGFFESRAVISIHDQLLASCGGSWDAPRVPDSAHRAAATRLLEAFIRDLPGPVCAVKDPRASLFVDIWRDACIVEGVKLCVLEVLRDPEDIAASLARREGWTIQRGRELAEVYESALDKAAGSHVGDNWRRICFPGELDQEHIWRGIFDSFRIPLRINMEGARSFVDRALIHHPAPAPAKWTVIIPSRSDEKVLDCVASLIEAHPEIEPEQIVIVDDGLSWRTRRKLRSLTLVTGVKPFVFARAVNMGVDAAPPGSDIVILGDDVRFKTEDALNLLAGRALRCAAIAPQVVGVCGQRDQRVWELGQTADWLAFICVYIPRRAWDAVGQLDERFVGYGYDDVDWCKRAQAHGPLLIAHDVTVEHLHDSTYRGRKDWELQYAKNRAIFEEKWRQQGVA